MYPELSFNEYETAKYIKKTLGFWGISYNDKFKNNGIEVVLGPKTKKKIVAFRADFDALPIEEENNIDYKSRNKGVMHACGHDAHTACLLGVIKILNSFQTELNGQVKFIFQPAEERAPGGAKQMIKDGVLYNPKVDYIFAQHVFPELKTGMLGFKKGKYMASADELYFKIKGKGGHAAIPSSFNNPINPAIELVLKLNKEFKKEKKSILSVGFFNANGSTNIIPEVVEISGTFRSLVDSERKSGHKKINEICKEVSNSFDVDIFLEIRKGYPPLENNFELTEKARLLAIDYLGEENIVDLSERMTAEDFSYFSREIPGCFYRLGTGNHEKETNFDLHTSKFNIDEDALKNWNGDDGLFSC